MNSCKSIKSNKILSELELTLIKRICLTDESNIAIKIKDLSTPERATNFLSILKGSLFTFEFKINSDYISQIKEEIEIYRLLSGGTLNLDKLLEGERASDEEKLQKLSIIDMLKCHNERELKFKHLKIEEWILNNLENNIRSLNKNFDAQEFVKLININDDWFFYFDVISVEITLDKDKQSNLRNFLSNYIEKFYNGEYEPYNSIKSNEQHFEVYKKLLEEIESSTQLNNFICTMFELINLITKDMSFEQREKPIVQSYFKWLEFFFLLEKQGYLEIKAIEFINKNDFLRANNLRIANSLIDINAPCKNNNWKLTLNIKKTLKDIISENSPSLKDEPAPNKKQIEQPLQIKAKKDKSIILQFSKINNTFTISGKQFILKPFLISFLKEVYNHSFEFRLKGAGKLPHYKAQQWKSYKTIINKEARKQFNCNILDKDYRFYVTVRGLDDFNKELIN